MEENRKKAKQFSGMFKNSNELIINYGTLKYLSSEYQIKIKSRVTEKGKRRKEKKERKTDGQKETNK